jgi:hypothetical protein
MTSNYRNIQIKIASRSKVLKTKNIHEELAVTIANWKKIARQLFTDDIHTQLARTISAHYKIMEQFTQTLSQVGLRRLMENKTIAA